MTQTRSSLVLVSLVCCYLPADRLALGLFTAAVINLLVPRTVLGPVIEFKVRGPQRRPSPRIVSDSDENAARREASISTVSTGKSTSISIDTSVETIQSPVSDSGSVFITSPVSAASELPPNLLHAKSE